LLDSKESGLVAEDIMLLETNENVEFIISKNDNSIKPKNLT